MTDNSRYYRDHQVQLVITLFMLGKLKPNLQKEMQAKGAGAGKRIAKYVGIPRPFAGVAMTPA